MQPTDKVSLTYEQVQALGEVIKNNIGQAKELTTDDYDYPTGSPTSVAAWLLPPGLYTAAESVRISICAGATLTISAKKNFIVLNGPGASNKTIVDLANRDGLNPGITMYHTTTAGNCVGTYMQFLTRDDVTDNLNSIAGTAPLSANQGRILNNKIQALVDYANYSTSEINTGATWIDGSTIYKKTIATGALPNVGSPTSVAHGIANLNTVISLSGFAKNGTIQIPLPFPFVNNSTLSMFVTENGYIQFDTTDNRSDFSGYVTMYYTKSS